MRDNPNRKFSHVVVTGASGGIGAALALHYAQEGIVLSMTGRNPERLGETARQCRERGAQVHTGIIDVTNREGMETWLGGIDDANPVDIVIANSGISAGTGGILHGEDPGQVRRLFEVNVTGVLNTVEPLLPRMIARGKGHVALMSSLAAFRGWPGAPAYCASKAAVKVYGEGLRGALRKTGVRVHVICPGFVRSRMTDANDYPMPFLIGADKAARIIASGIERNKGRIAFPLPAHCAAWMFGAMPDFLAQAILKKSPAKKADGAF